MTLSIFRGLLRRGGSLTADRAMARTTLRLGTSSVGIWTPGAPGALGRVRSSS